MLTRASNSIYLESKLLFWINQAKGDKMNRYIVTNRATDEHETVSAESHLEAAEIIIRKNSKSKNIVVRRVTGDGDRSGIFQGYVSALGSLSSAGAQYHVRLA
jgi:hypothetical protein